MSKTTPLRWGFEEREIEEVDVAIVAKEEEKRILGWKKMEALESRRCIYR